MRDAALLALAILVLPACADEGGGSDGPSTDPDDLTGVTWRLDDATLKELASPDAGPVVVSLVFADGQVSGTSGCNSYFGTYEADDDGSLSIGALGGTEMACEEPLMTLESAYLAALGGVVGFSVDGGVLTLEGADVRLGFFEEIPPEPLPLVGTTWSLDSVYQGDAVSSTIAGTDVTLTMGDDGAASGSGGCNRYHGIYTADGDALSFGPLASTKMACAEDVMAQEAAFFDAMARVASTTIEGERLTLLDASGAPLLGLVGPGAPTV